MSPESLGRNLSCSAFFWFEQACHTFRSVLSGQEKYLKLATAFAVSRRDCHRSYLWGIGV